VYDVGTAVVDAVMVLRRQVLRDLLFGGRGRRRVRVVGHVRLLLAHDGRRTAALLLVIVQMALQRRSATRVTVQRGHEMREGILLLSGSRAAVGPGQVQVEQFTFSGRGRGHHHFLVVTAGRAAGTGAVLLLLLLKLHGQLLLVVLVEVLVGVHLLDSVQRFLLEHDVFELGMLLLLLLVRLLLVLVKIFVFVALLQVLMYLLLTRDQYLREHSGHQVSATAVLGLLISLCNQHIVVATVWRRSATVTVVVIVVDTGRRCRSRRTGAYM